MSITPKKQMENACEISPHTWPEPEGVRCEQESRDRRRTGRLAPHSPRPHLQRRIMTRMMKSCCLLAVAALVAARSCAAHSDVSAASPGADRGRALHEGVLPRLARDAELQGDCAAGIDDGQLRHRVRAEAVHGG